MTFTDLHLLPGSETQSKRIAMESNDARMRGMLRVAAETGWPLAFCDDFYCHDLALLADMPEEEFVWVLRAHGTHLYPLRGNSHEIRHYRNTCSYYAGSHKLNDNGGVPMARYYLVRRTGVTEITCEQASDSFEIVE